MVWPTTVPVSLPGSIEIGVILALVPTVVVALPAPE